MGIILPIASELMIELGRALEAQTGLGFIGKGLAGAGQMIQSVTPIATNVEAQTKINKSLEAQAEKAREQITQLERQGKVQVGRGGQAIGGESLEKAIEEQNAILKQLLAKQADGEEHLKYLKSIKANSQKSAEAQGAVARY